MGKSKGPKMGPEALEYSKRKKKKLKHGKALRKKNRATYKFKKRPYRHQVAALKKLMANEWGGALLMDPRTGKTKVSIDYACMLHQAGRVNRVLVLCPLGPMGVWVDEIKANCQFAGTITIWDRDGRKSVDLPSFGRDKLDWVIVNYDALSTAPPKRTVHHRDGTTSQVPDRRGGRFAIRNKLQAWQPQLIIADEMHRLKSPTARKTAMVSEVAWQEIKNGRVTIDRVPRSDYRVGLTGTVLTKRKRIYDIYSQWKNFVNPHNPMVKGRDLKAFKSYFSVMTERNGYPQWLRNKPREMQLLIKWLHQDSFAVTRDECFDLPLRTDQIIHVDLEESGPYYDQMAEEMVARLESGEISWAKIPLVQRTRLLQLTSGIAKTEPTDAHPEGRLARVGTEKLRVIQSRWEDLFEAEEKIVVGARWRGDIAALSEMARKMKVPVYEFHGGISIADREIARKQFGTSSGPEVFIANPQAKLEGIDLRRAAIFQWFSLTSSWVDFRQLEDRVALSERPTFFEYFLARGTIDELQLVELRGDGELAETVTASPHKLLRNFK